jgi:hypothetical protein
MMPPPIEGEPNLAAPVAHWMIIDSFDTAADCSRALVLTRNKVREEKYPSPGVRNLGYSACISSDDRRLAR